MVAPPIITGRFKPKRVISPKKYSISSKEGVIKPLNAMMSAFSSIAVWMILSAGTITPKSITSKLLHCITTLTMFLPMSCTSPFTVAITTLPLLEPFCLVALINGSKYATDCFITRADFTTCGRNILPSPNKSPTTSMPAINGPSITSNGLGNVWRASSVSSTM